MKDGLVDLLAQSEVGDPRRDNTLVGPMIDERDARRAHTWCEEAVAAGAKRLAAGARERAALWLMPYGGVRDTDFGQEGPKFAVRR